MTFLSHILVTTAGVQLLGLHGSDLILAYSFGVLIDFDHIIKAPLYFNKYKFKTTKHYNWRTPLQEPVSLLWVLPLSAFINTYVPTIFIIGHIVLDYFVDYPKHPFFPYSNFETKGFLSKIPQLYKELAVIALFSCINIILLLRGK